MHSHCVTRILLFTCIEFPFVFLGFSDPRLNTLKACGVVVSGVSFTYYSKYED